MKSVMVLFTEGMSVYRTLEINTIYFVTADFFMSPFRNVSKTLIYFIQLYA